MTDRKKNEDKPKGLLRSLSGDLLSLFGSKSEPVVPPLGYLAEEFKGVDPNALLPDVDDDELDGSSVDADASRAEPNEATTDLTAVSAEVHQPPSSEFPNVESTSPPQPQTTTPVAKNEIDSWSFLVSTLGVETQSKAAGGDNEPKTASSPPVTKQHAASSRKPEKAPGDASSRPPASEKETSAPSREKLGSIFGGFLAEEFEDKAGGDEARIESVLSDIFKPSLPPDEPSASKRMIDDTFDPIDEISEIDDVFERETFEDEFDDSDEYLEYEVEDLYSDEGEAKNERRTPIKGRDRSEEASHQSQRHRSRHDRNDRHERSRPQTKSDVKRHDFDEVNSVEEVVVREADGDRVQESDEATTVSPGKKSRRGRRKRKRAKSDQMQDAPVDRRDDDNEMEADEDERGPRSAGNGPDREQKFPTWNEAIAIIVNSNLAQRKKTKAGKRRRD
ncbi:MAG TPA: hypothetical protein PKD64_15635 [Pirellulaceae bacterium]|nr:hypothetical protein [Pirellulaceae bacterium]HMO93618.1 hypothetical protein [Pirellulaceae bacterium]HMP70490.1 hypothetical protein [Pirellulaceae bacterium]